MKNLRFISITLFAFLLVFARAADAEEKVILAMGDSLMAGYNLPPNASFPAQLETWLREQGADVRVLNSGVSGDTTASGRSRLDWSLASVPGGKPDLFILEFGGNDMLLQKQGQLRAVIPLDPCQTDMGLEFSVFWRESSLA